MTTTEVKNQVRVGGKFVACWGYDQTQYSVYNVVGVSGKSVLVEGMNSWSGLSESDLAPGSKVKVYKYTQWDDLTDEERADFESRNFDRHSYNHHTAKDAEEQATVRTIVKMNRIDGESWTYLWTLDNGEVVRSDDRFTNVKIIQGLKKCLVKSSYDGQPAIKISESIRAYHDPEYNNNKTKYAEQNEYTAYNGR